MSRDELSDIDRLVADINLRMKPLKLTKSAFIREAIAEKIARLRGSLTPSDGADKSESVSPGKKDGDKGDS